MAKHRLEEGLSLHDLFAYIQAGDPSGDPDFPGENTNWLDTTTPTTPIWKRYISGSWSTLVNTSTAHVPATVLDSSSIDFTISGQQITGSVILEWLQDTVATMLLPGNNVDVTYDDGAGTVTFDVEALTSADLSDFNEAVEDRIGLRVIGGTDLTATYNDGTGETTIDRDAITVTTGVTINMGDGTNVITSTEAFVLVKIPFACTVTAWEIVADASGSIVIIVYRAATATPTTFVEISGSSDPTLSSQQTNKDTSISGDWSDVTLDADDWLKFQVSGSPTTVKRIGLALTITRSI